MGTIKEIKALGVGFVGFYEGKREAYQADSYVDKLYFASDTGELLFNSKSYSVIVDDLLTSDSTIHALSANQGKQLKSLIDNIDSSVSEISLFALANTAGYTGTEEELINKLNTAYLPLTGGRLSGELTSSSSIKGTGYLGVAAPAFPQIQFQNTGSANYTSLLFTNILSGNVKSLIFRPDSTESSVDAVIYHSQNFVSGVNYVAPSTLDNYVDLTSNNIWI